MPKDLVEALTKRTDWLIVVEETGAVIDSFNGFEDEARELQNQYIELLGPMYTVSLKGPL